APCIRGYTKCSTMARLRKSGKLFYGRRSFGGNLSAETGGWRNRWRASWLMTGEISQSGYLYVYLSMEQTPAALTGRIQELRCVFPCLPQLITTFRQALSTGSNFPPK
ncbi:MAG: hypothetical protein OEX02_10040, partial [Cyclobacteriaceae bacterium]|nr:hypothetical protein [Cyclobacteriaceae bacterium]